MIRKELVLRVGRKIGLTDATTLDLLASFAEQRYRMMCEQANWKDLLVLWSTTVPAGAAEVILPHQIGRWLAARYGHTNLLPIDQLVIFAQDPELFDRSGPPRRVAQLSSVGLRVQPTSERLTLVSSNSGDTAKTVSIVGELAGAEIRERITLSGTTPVQTAGSFDRVYQLTKELTAGTVTVSGFTSAATLGHLASDEQERQHIRLRLLETPTESIALTVLGKRTPPPMSGDADAPAIRGLDAAWEAFVMADAYEWMRQGDDAAAKIEEGVALLNELKASETWRETGGAALTPADGVGHAPDLWNSNGFSGKSSW
jgi:hypothetical protein